MATIRNTFSATFPDGTVETSKTVRNYTHAVIVRVPRTGAFAVLNWCGSLELAHKALAKAQRDFARFDNCAEVQIVPVAG